MHISAIIAEYNPFHNGHRYLISRAKEAGADHVIVLMSGDFVQRGEPAILDRHARAEMAIKGGADLVLAYPTRYATGSAERYAEYAVRILDGLGAVDALVFGSECGEIGPLMECAKNLADEPDWYRDTLREGLKAGLSYPKARAEALPDYAELLREPNNLLGIEYCKALLRTGSGIEARTFRRVGQPHLDAQSMGAYASASAIRRAAKELYAGQEDLRKAMPESAATFLLNRMRRGEYVSSEDLSSLLLARIWSTDRAEELEACQDVTRALAGTILKQRHAYRSCGEFAALVASKSLTVSHVQRALLHLALNLRKDDPGEGGLLTQVLAQNRESASLLSALTRSAQIPIIVRPACDGTALQGREQALFAEETRFANLYEALQAAKVGRDAVHAFSRGIRRCGL